MYLLLTLILTIVFGGTIVLLCSKRIQNEQLVDLRVDSTDISILTTIPEKIELVNLPK